jgi:hypothetical protein
VDANEKQQRLKTLDEVERVWREAKWDADSEEFLTDECLLCQEAEELAPDGILCCACSYLLVFPDVLCSLKVRDICIRACNNSCESGRQMALDCIQAIREHIARL